MNCRSGWTGRMVLALLGLGLLGTAANAAELGLTPVLRGTTASAQGATQADGDGTSLTRLAREHGLALTSSPRSNRLELSGGGVRLVLVPGLPLARLNGRTHALAQAPVYRGQSLHVPTALLRLLPKPKPEAPARLDTVVVLDPGHGGRDPGAIGHGNLREKDVNLAIALYLREYLRARGVRVVMTREGDTYPSLQARADLANRTPNSVFVSIHANAARSRSARGVETFVLSGRISDRYRADRAASRYRLNSSEELSAWGRKQRINDACKEARDESLALARAVQAHLAGVSGDTDRGVRRQNLHVLRESYFSPAILVEVGFLTHAPTARRLASDTHRRRLAQGLAEGLVEYLQGCAGRRDSAWKTLLPEGAQFASRR